jgi:hypothetical protein
MSAKDRMERKKYMDVCRWGSEIVARMISMFPSTVTRYMKRNSQKRTDCNLESSKIPKRRNFKVHVSFSDSICWCSYQKI